MDFRDLTYVLAIAKHQNITKAADSLYLSQPTLTKFLQSLEKELGQKLFRKLGNKFLLTYAGERYIAKANEILLIKKELDSELNDIVKNNVGILKVAFPVMRGTYMLPCTLPIFHSLYPNVKLDIVEANSGQLESMILNGETDLAFFNLPIHSNILDYDIISHEEILLVLSHNHPLAEKGVLTGHSKYPWMDLKLLKEDKFILQVPEQRTRQIVDGLLKKEEITPNIILETRNIQASLLLAAKGYGACFICETHMKHIQTDLAPRYFSVGNPATTVDFVAAYRKNAYLPYHAKEYIKIVKDFT